MSHLRMAVVGVGHLGKEHARILAGLPNVTLVGVVDTDRDQAEAVAFKCHTRAFTDYRELFGQVDAACIVTPTTWHHAIACEFLSRGIPLLVEKPLALNSTQANELVRLSHDHGTTLQVGHIERFNPAYEELRHRPIEPQFIEIERHGAFTGRSTDIGVVLDLMIHDLDLLLDLIAQPVTAIDACGATAFGGHEDMVNARLRFEGGCVAHLTASRISPNPKRKLRIWAREGYAGIDFVKKHLTLVQPSEELRRRRVDTQHMSRGTRDRLKDQVFTRYLQTQELDCNRGDQLTREIEHFVDCVRTGSVPRVPGEAGRDAIALAERILDQVDAHLWQPGPAGWLFEPEELPQVQAA